MMTAIMSSTGKDLKTLHRYLKTYWQRGKTKNAYLPKYSERGGKGKERVASGRKRGSPRKYNDNVGINVDELMQVIFGRRLKSITTIATEGRLSTHMTK